MTSVIERTRWPLAAVVAVALAGFTASPAWAISEISSTSDTTVTAGLNKSVLEDPLVGSPSEDCLVAEWVDADTAACPGWTYFDNLGDGVLSGNPEECFLLSNNLDSLTATTTVPTEIVALHLAGDINDGLSEIRVDGVLKATVDHFTNSPPADYAQVIVTGLALGVHTIEIRGTGTSTTGGAGNDVALLGAAACSPVAIPTASEEGLIAITVFLLAALTIFVARRRHRVA